MLKKIIGTVVGLAIVVVGMEIYLRTTESPPPPPPPIKTEKETGRLVVDRKIVVDYTPHSREEITRYRLQAGKKPHSFQGLDLGRQDMVIQNLVKDGLEFNDKDMLAFFSSPYPMADELFIQHCFCKVYDTKDPQWCKMLLRTPIPTAKELYEQCLSFSLMGFLLRMLLDDVPPDKARQIFRELEFPETTTLPQRLLFPLYQLHRYVFSHDMDPSTFTCDQLPSEYVEICKDTGFDGGPNKYDPTDRVTYLQKYMVFKHLKSIRDTGKPANAKLAKKNYFWRLEPIVQPGQLICEKHLIEEYTAGTSNQTRSGPEPEPGPGDGADGPYEEMPSPEGGDIESSGEVEAMEAVEPADLLPIGDAPPFVDDSLEEDLPSGDLPVNVEDAPPEDLPSDDLPANIEDVPEENLPGDDDLPEDFPEPIPEPEEE